MRQRTLLAAVLAAGFTGGGILYAQPGASAPAPTPAGGSQTPPAAPAPTTPTPAAPTPTPTPPPAPAPGAGGGSDLPDVSVSGEKEVKLSPQEMTDTADRLIKEMEGFHRSTLELQAAAKQAKDVIKLNCVNEDLLAVKQLLNIADEAKTNLTEAKIQGDRSELVHQFSQITIAEEKAKQAHDEAMACIGEELHFVGKDDLTVEGPAVRHDPTDDLDNGEIGGEDPYSTPLEDPGYASPFAPL